MTITEINQKDVCLKIRDGLIENLKLHPKKVIANTTYTHIQLDVSEEIKHTDILERIKRILQSDCQHLYTPIKARPNKFVAILNDHFAEIEVRTAMLHGWTYNIYIMVPYNTIQYEWWYDEFMDSF